MDFKPLHDNVVIERSAKDEVSKGGIIIPDNAQEKAQEGRVLAVGPGITNDNGVLLPLTVKQGDVVLFKKWSGTELTIEGSEVVVVTEHEIIGIVG